MYQYFSSLFLATCGGSTITILCLGFSFDLLTADRNSSLIQGLVSFQAKTNLVHGQVRYSGLSMIRVLLLWLTLVTIWSGIISPTHQSRV